MTESPDPRMLAAAARRLRDALRQETALARAGALSDLTAAGEAKAQAFADFRQASAGLGGAPPAAARAALRELLDAAGESALVLEAVGNTLQHAAETLRRTLSAAADPGLYSPRGRASRHVLAARIDARI